MKHIEYEYDGRTYSLAFNRESVKNMESKGFSFDAVEAKPMTMIPMLFHGAFLTYHPGTKGKLIDEMWDECPDKEGIIIALGELYMDTVSDFMSINDEAASKKATWKIAE